MALFLLLFFHLIDATTDERRVSKSLSENRYLLKLKFIDGKESVCLCVW